MQGTGGVKRQRRMKSRARFTSVLPALAGSGVTLGGGFLGDLEDGDAAIDRAPHREVNHLLRLLAQSRYVGVADFATLHKDDSAGRVKLALKENVAGLRIESRIAAHASRSVSAFGASGLLAARASSDFVEGCVPGREKRYGLLSTARW